MQINAEALLQISATTLAGMFAGAALYVNVAQQPAMLQIEDLKCQAPFFKRMYYYASRLQAPLALGSGICAIGVAVSQRDRKDTGATPRLWLSTGCAMISIVPYTIFKMLALNKKLIDPDYCEKQGKPWVMIMLRRWARLHAVRTGASILAFGGMVVAMAHGSVHEQNVKISMYAV